MVYIHAGSKYKEFCFLRSKMDSSRTSAVNSVSLSLDSDEGDEFWKKLLDKLTIEKLELLHDKYFEPSKRIDKFGIKYEYRAITRKKFLNAIDELFGKGKFSYQALCLFNEITTSDELGWNQLITFFLENANEENEFENFKLDRILTFDCVKKQTIVKIVLIETDISFCYIVVTKYGQVGIYDSQWRLLWSYIAILDEISAKGFYSAKKRHIKWITDVLYMADAEILVIATSARCLVFYDTSRLHHIPIWFVSGIRNIPQCMTYYYDNNKSILFFGDEYGNVFKIVWIQPKVALLPRKMKDRLSLYYWRELYLQPDYVSLSIPQKIHETKICNISYLPKNQTLITCCETRKRSLILTDLAGCMDSYIFNINRGVTAYFLELEREILVTGGNDTIIRVWNRFVTNKPMALLTGHNSKIVDVCINIVYEMIISLSEDGYLKVWNLTEYYCIQTLHLVFPSFSVLGKVVEWGSTRSIFPGPCLKQIKDVPKTGLETNCGKEIMSEQSQVGLCPSLNLRLSKMVSLETVQEVNENRENEWCRDNFVVICCNHIAILKLNRDSQKSEDGFYSAPHSYKEEVVPKSWKEILSKQLKKKTPTTINDLNEKQSVDQLDLKFRAKFNILEIMEKDDLFSSGAQCSINRQMLKLEQLKELMKPRVEICAPYTALKLNDLAEMKFSENIPLGRSRQQRRSMEKTTRLLATCNLTPIAANNLTDRSSKSSTNRSTFRSTTSSQFNLEFSNISK